MGDRDGRCGQRGRDGRRRRPAGGRGRRRAVGGSGPPDSSGSPRGCRGSRTGSTAAAFVAASARRSATPPRAAAQLPARRGAAGHAGRRPAGRGVASGMNWLTAQVVAMGPRLRIRDQATLRAQFPGQSDDEIAQRLIERAARAADGRRRGDRGLGGAARAARVPRRGRGGDAGRRGDRGQAGGRAARDLRHAAPRQRHRAGACLPRILGVTGAASTRWTAACCSSPGSPLARQLTRRLAAPRSPVDVRARPAVHRRDGRGGAQPAGDAAAGPRDQGRPAPAPPDRDR